MRISSLAAAAKIGICVMFLLAQGQAAQSAEVHVFSVLPLKTFLDELGPQFERTTGHKLMIKYDVSASLKRQIADWPVKGVLAHIAGPIPGGFRVIDVWESRAAFKRFGKTLAPVMKKVGMRGAKIKIFPLVRFIKT